MAVTVAELLNPEQLSNVTITQKINCPYMYTLEDHKGHRGAQSLGLSSVQNW